ILGSPMGIPPRGVPPLATPSGGTSSGGRGPKQDANWRLARRSQKFPHVEEYSQSAAFSPRSKRGRHLAKLRREAEAPVEQLLALLDELDGDPELEPSLGAAEEHPCGGILGAPTPSRGSQGLWAQGDRQDREGDDSDDEPSLGAPEVF